MYIIFVFAKCYWSIHSKMVRLGKNARHAKKGYFHTNSAAVACGGLVMPGATA